MTALDVTKRNEFIREVCPRSILNLVLSAPKIEEQTKNAEVITEIDQSCKYYSNEDLLGLILNQLVDNALTFRQKERSHKAYINITATNEKITIAIIDNGMGIPENEQGIFYDASFVKTSAKPERVTGLHIVRSAVARLGGTIDLYSVAGSVTQVAVTLPNMAR